MPKQSVRIRRFAEFYARFGDAKKAALAAGYSNNPKTICVTASKLSKRPDVQKVVEEYQQKQTEINQKYIEEAGMGVSEILERISDIARNDENVAARLKALELAGKSHAMFSDRSIVETEARELYRQISYPEFKELSEKAKKQLPKPKCDNAN